MPTCPYLDASTFRDHDLPHVVEAFEVGLREAGGQDGAPALCEVASAGPFTYAGILTGPLMDSKKYGSILYIQ